MTAGQISDYTGAAALLDDLPKAKWLLATAAMTLTGSGKLCKRRVSGLHSWPKIPASVARRSG
jgi:hypothetical protein